MELFWLYPILVVLFFLSMQYAHKRVNPAVSESNPMAQSMYTLFYVSAGASAAALLMNSYSDVLNEFICTMLNLPIESTKENVEVFIGEPAF
jgi:hypothetical protein